MTVEQATLAITVIILAMQGVNMYTTARLKLWALEKFVSKSDFLDNLHLWSRDNERDFESNRAAHRTRPHNG